MRLYQVIILTHYKTLSYTSLEVTLFQYFLT